MMANDKSVKEALWAASPFLFKLLELILTAVSLCVIIPPYNSNKLGLQPSVTKAAFIYSAYTGALFINILIIATHCLGDRMPKKSCLIIGCFYGIALLLVSIMLIQDWRNIQTTAVYPRPSKHYTDMHIASGMFCLIASFSFIIDTALTFKYA